MGGSASGCGVGGTVAGGTGGFGRRDGDSGHSGGCGVTDGYQIERHSPQTFGLASAREGRATGSGVLRRGYLGKCERAGVRLCKGAA